MLPSSSLVLDADPTLLFVNSGMVQFKYQFMGNASLQNKNVVTVQKCMRAGGKHNDLDNVGYTPVHHTFFEMLGNFSFGGYFKEQAILFAWEFLTKILLLDKSKLYITVLDGDDESFKIWKQLTCFGSDKIIKKKNTDNFWSMGEIGPCGPSTEIFYKHSDGLDVEIWNIVFIELEKLQSGKYIKLPVKCIDTGMGLERITAVMQGMSNNFDTDIFSGILEFLKLNYNNLTVISRRIIADHIRSICFLIYDGVLPGNDRRSYVLRKIIRRAIRYANILGVANNFLSKIVPVCIAYFRDMYPCFYDDLSFAQDIIFTEEKLFASTFCHGMKYLSKELTQIDVGDLIDSKILFTLHDTYGLQIDFIKDFLGVKNIKFNIDDYNVLMNKQKLRSNITCKEIVQSNLLSVKPTCFLRDFVSYDGIKVQAILCCNVNIERAFANQEVVIILDKTPFYAESGGQIGDVGWIDNNYVIDTQVLSNKYYGHFTKLKSTIVVGQTVNTLIDIKRRNKISANHSTVHLLHHALRKFLGPHVVQKGSFISDTKLRFDFLHPNEVGRHLLSNVEVDVNDKILSDYIVSITEMPFSLAVKNNILALFREKYQDVVSVVKIGQAVELCGGTHVKSTGRIGCFLITNFCSVSSGIKRIEGVTGMEAIRIFRSNYNILDGLSHNMSCGLNNLLSKCLFMKNSIKELQKENIFLKSSIDVSRIKFYSIKKYKILYGVYQTEKIFFKIILSIIKKQHKDFVLILINCAEFTNRVQLFISVSSSIVDKVSASFLLQSCNSIIFAKGGGNKEIAQSQGYGIANAYLIIKRVVDIIKNKHC